MATNRLTFLYPHLCRTGRLGDRTASARSTLRIRATAPVSQQKSARKPPSCQHAAASFTTASPARRPVVIKRHGTAVEPQPPPPPPSIGATQPTGAEEAQKVSQQSVPGIDQGQDSARIETPPVLAARSAPQQAIKHPEATTCSSPIGGSDSIKHAIEGAAAAAAATGEASPAPSPPPPQDPLSKIPSGPMEAILYMGAPSSSPPDLGPGGSSNSSDSSETAAEGDDGTPSLQQHKPPPHLTPPPYVHHFDSYSLVKHLTAGGFTLNQAITAMKAVRGSLAANLDVAQAGLVSKSDVENETYLFRAACSELSTEVRNNRRVADELLRQQRTLLQHEGDIVTQRLNQELLTLNDTVRGMFNDRRMAVREEQKTVDSAIQQINYKISVTLNSDAKSEIEGLRWVLIRRSVLGIIFMAVLTLGTLRYASYVSHEREKEAEKRAREEEQARKYDAKQDNTSAPEAAEILAAS